MNDDVLTRNSDGELSVRTVSATETSTVVNPNDVYTRDTDGNLAIRTVGGSGGGGSVDYTKVVSKTETMPTASSSNENIVYMYMGETNANYTHGYIYENKKTATYTGTVNFETATLSGTVVTCSGDNFANFLTEAGADPTPIVSGTMTYEADATGWRLVGKDSNDNTITTFLEYVEDYEDFGFTFTGTPEDGDVVAFTCTVEEASASYAWNRIDVQPNEVTSVNGQTGDVTVQETLISGTNIKTINNNSILGGGNLDIDALPSQTGNDGKFLKTNGTTASWENITSSPATAPTLLSASWVNNSQTINVTGVTATNTVIVSPTPVSAEDYADAGVLCTNQGAGTLTFTCQTTPANDLTVNIVIM